jgi:hypothetical protein
MTFRASKDLPHAHCRLYAVYDVGLTTEEKDEDLLYKISHGDI